MTTTYRWTSTDVNPRDAHRALHLTNAVKGREDTASTTYQLGNCRVEVFNGTFPALLISGPTDEPVTDAAARLGYRDTESTVTEVKDEVPTRR